MNREQIASEARSLALEDAARMIDDANRTGPYQAIGAAKHIREAARNGCPAHVAASDDAKFCGRCGISVYDLAPLEEGK